MKAQIEKVLEELYLRGGQISFDDVFGKAALNKATSSLTTLIIKWLEGKKQKLWTDESIDYQRMNSNLDQETEDVYTNGRNQLITELVEELK